LWTSPIPSTSGFCYYLAIVDDYSHYFWSFPLHKKSDVYPTFVAFHAFVTTHFNLPIRTIQCDNGKEFDNTKLNTFFQTHGTVFRFFCPYTSQQNGKAERAICTTNDGIRCLLFQASMPPNLWAKALHTTTYLLNKRPTAALCKQTPHFFLYGFHPSYDHLCVFGCLCYVNTSYSPT
jgi:hypothetical protein